MKRFILALSMTTVLGNMYSAHAKVMEEIRDETLSKGVLRLPLEKLQDDPQEKDSLRPQASLTKQLVVPPARGLSEPKENQAPIYYSRKQAKKLAKAERKRARRIARWARIRAKMIKKGLIVERVITVHHTPIQNVFVPQDSKVGTTPGHTVIINFKPKFVFPLTLSGQHDDQAGQTQTSQSRLNSPNKDIAGNNISLGGNFNESDLNEHLFSHDDHELVAGSIIPAGSQFHVGEENAEPALNLNDENLIKDVRLESLSTSLNDLNEKIGLFEAKRISASTINIDLKLQKKELETLISNLTYLKHNLNKLAPQMQDGNVPEDKKFGDWPTKITNLEYLIEQQEERLGFLKSKLDNPSSAKEEKFNETIFNNHLNTLVALQTKINYIKNQEVLFNHDLNNLEEQEELLGKAYSIVNSIQSNLKGFIKLDDHLANAKGENLSFIEDEILQSSLKKTQEFLNAALEKLNFQKQHPDTLKQDKTSFSSNTSSATMVELPNEEKPTMVNQASSSISMNLKEPINASILKEQENFELKSDTISGVIQPLANAINNLLPMPNLETLLEQFQKEESLLSLGIKSFKTDLLALGSSLSIPLVFRGEKEDSSVASKLKTLQSLISPYLALHLNEEQMQLPNLKTKILSVKTWADMLAYDFEGYSTALKSESNEITETKVSNSSMFPTIQTSLLKDEALEPIEPNALASILQPLMVGLEDLGKALAGKKIDLTSENIKKDIDHLKIAYGEVKQNLIKIKDWFSIDSTDSENALEKKINLTLEAKNFEAEIHDLKSQIQPFLTLKLDPSKLTEKRLRNLIAIVDGWGGVCEGDCQRLKEIIQKPSLSSPVKVQENAQDLKSKKLKPFIPANDETDNFLKDFVMVGDIPPNTKSAQ